MVTRGSKKNEEEASGALGPNQTLVIEVVKGPSKGKVYRAGPNQKQLSVGRTKASVVHVKSPGVSEKHAEVVWSPEKTSWCIRDVGSSNGTVVNGENLEPEVLARPLRDGDRVKLGLQSELLIQVVDVPDENITVEQYLNKECDRLISKMQSRTSELVGDMKKVLA
ncbi:SMAD/FHA domain-containing protein [Chloropicon primus]|uniref:SMAD/FHA domain-containing protein n=1 Tax=Chloropicon primus TaxID=1764295 RepID=A0A5B8MQA6_9CHLO|nr:SMAD/FHA domain-containing protein [Chloropicon primus]UPR01015.1 SMAD/FHA domain-containing protein [Chloropicon primus]|eukprot:QDZ21795.1 SMAD/FHA domain-containing protein [Chloropicon primus]